MNSPILVRLLVFCVLVLLCLSLFVAYAAPTEAAMPAQVQPEQFVTTITVDSGADPDDSKSKTCTDDPPCTLRRAIVEARGLPANARPVLIKFDIPEQASEGWDSTLDIWKIEPRTTSDPSVFRALEGGQITVDGSTQPGGRSSGPKIVIEGPGTGQKDGLIVGVNNSGDHDVNVVRGLAFQNFKTHLIVNSNDNLIEQNWFGLSDLGNGAYLRNDDPQDGSGSAGIALSANVEGNTLRQNVFLAFDGVAAAIRGDSNVFSDNRVGTTAIGDVPDKETDPSIVCISPDDWLGGGGITLEGDKHRIEGNIFAGLRQQIFQTSTQPDAIKVTGTKHIIEDNQIGVDEDGTQVGVCGRGIYLADPKEVNVSKNIIVNPGLSAISLNGKLYDANLLRSNIITQTLVWVQVKGNPEAEDAIQVGPSLPDAFTNFKPAKMTEIQGTTVSGTSGDGSPCPECVIELFLDDTDGIKEALQSLAVVTADKDGNWTASIPSELTNEQALRTTSTTAKFNTIAGMRQNTTTGLSDLYGQGSMLFMPFITRP